ncbi:MAG: hypothetical protein IJ297_01865, partial [Clostridia bacterium]|nr:hypothetical protein [Clostridia bacterium]
MPYIKVDTRRLSGFGNTSAAARGRVGSIKSSFSSIGSALDWDVKACSGINRTIGQINNELSNEMASLKRMEAFFDMAVRKYNDADEAKPEAKKVHTSSVQKIVPGNFRSTTKNATLTSILKSNNIVKAGLVKVNKEDNAFVELIKKIALEVGVVGSVTGLIDAAYKASKGQYIDAVETFGDMVKGAAKTWPDLAKIIGDIRGPSRLATS